MEIHVRTFIVCVLALRALILMLTGIETASFFRARAEIRSLGTRLRRYGFSVYNVTFNKIFSGIVIRETKQIGITE